jgi:hypothetical protein
VSCLAVRLTGRFFSPTHGWGVQVFFVWLLPAELFLLFSLVVVDAQQLGRHLVAD